ncbi:MAG: hypothetical protein ACYCPD_00025 [Acidobacteriaceae bacterium]
MLFEPYTRAGMLTRVDADCAIVPGPLADFPPAWARKRIGFRWVLATIGWMLLLPAWFATAQPPQTGVVPGTTVAGHSTASSAKKPSLSSKKSTAGKTSPARHPVHHAAHPRRHAKPAAAAVTPAPVAPAPPVAPADQPADPAIIDFSNGLLSVHAQNSSLIDILTQISRRTGLVIEGLSHDARMYGQYGPDNLSATLSALLDGSGYNYVIVGGGSVHSPTRLILSTVGGAAAANLPAEGSNAQAPSAASEPSVPADPTAPVQPKTPQEIFNEMRRMHPQ